MTIIYRYSTQNRYLLSTEIKNKLDIIEYLIRFSMELFRDDIEYKIAQEEELKPEYLYLLEDNKKSYILSLFSTKYFIISSPFKFTIKSGKIQINLDSKKIELIDIKILGYMFNNIKENYDKINRNYISINSLDEAFNNFKKYHDIDDIKKYNLEKNDIKNVLISLFSYNFYYSRYDYDLKNASDLHPLHHIDFSLENSLKLGLYRSISYKDFIDLNLNKVIYFIDKNKKTSDDIILYEQFRLQYISTIITLCNNNNNNWKQYRSLVWALNCRIYPFYETNKCIFNNFDDFVFDIDKSKIEKLINYLYNIESNCKQLNFKELKEEFIKNNMSRCELVRCLVYIKLSNKFNNIYKSLNNDYEISFLNNEIDFCIEHINI